MMVKKRVFLLDANVFIEAKRRYYAFDLCPGFWECLTALHGEGRFYSIDQIKDELERGGDDLTAWVSKKMPSDCFISTDDAAVIANYGQIVLWVDGQEQLRDEAKAAFMKNADGWLIACAKAKDMVVVTHEVFDPEVRKKAPIPNVCREFGVEYVDTFQMLREVGVSFHWKPPK